MASAPAKGGSTPAKGGPGKGGARTTSAPPAPNYNSPLYQPGQQLAGKSLSDAAHGIANAATDGPLSALAQQIAQNNQQGAAAQKTTMGYYMQLAKDAQAAYGQMQGVNSGLNNQLNGTELTTASAIQGLGQQAQSGAMGRLAGMGLGGDSPGMLANQTAQNQATGALNYGNYRSAGAMQNANYQDHALGAIQAQGLRGQERIGNMAQATRVMNAPLSAREATLIANRGNLYSNALGTLRGQERNYQVASAGLGIRRDTLAVTAANDAAKNSLTARGQNISAATAAANRQNQAGIAAANRLNQFNIAQGHNATSIANTQARVDAKAGAGSPAKPASAAYQAKVYGQLSKATGIIQQAQATGKYSEQQIRALTASKYGIPDYVIEAAYELLGYGALSPRTAGLFHSLGLRGGTFRGQPIKVGNTQVQQGTSAVGNAVGGIGNLGVHF